MRNVKTILATLTTGLMMVGTAQATSYTVGNLPNDGTLVNFTQTLESAGDLDFYDFTLVGDINNGDGTYLNIQTFGQAGFDPLDTQIALYDNTGFLVDDDDGNADGTYTLFYSLLTFGDSDPYGTNVDTIAGEDGLLNLGDYTLVIGGFSTNFTQDIQNITGGASTGDYNLQFSSVTTPANAPVPEPATLSLLGMGLVGLVARTRRKKQA